MTWPEHGAMGCLRRRLERAGVPLPPRPADLERTAEGKELLRRAGYYPGSGEGLGLFEPMPHQRRFIEASIKYRHRLFIAGNRAGKTETGAWEASAIQMGAHPFIHYAQPVHGFVLAPTLEQAEQINLPKILGWLPSEAIEYLPSILGGHKRLKIKDSWGGGYIDFHASKQGRETMQGGAYHWAWFDEEPPEDVATEVEFRLIDYRGCSFWTMTPLKGKTWLYHAKVINPPGDTFVMTASTLENTTLSREDIATIEAKIKPEERLSRIEGQFISQTGACPFDRVMVSDRAGEAPAPLFRQRWVDDISAEEFGRWVMAAEDDPVSGPCGNVLRVWEEPEDGVGYAVGADVSAGLSEGCSSTACVLRLPERVQVAEFEGDTEPHNLAHVIASLGRRYNMAYVGPEVTGIGSATQDRLRDVYPRDRQFRREVPNAADVERGKHLGWSANVRTKSIAVQGMVAWFAEDPARVQSVRLLRQMETFERRGEKYGPMVGCRSDLVSGAYVALEVAGQAPAHGKARPAFHWTRDQRKTIGIGGALTDKEIADGWIELDESGRPIGPTMTERTRSLMHRLMAEMRKRLGTS